VRVYGYSRPDNDAILSYDAMIPLMQGLQYIASTAHVQDNSYKFWNIEHMYTKGEPQGLSRAFLAYMYSNAPSYINQPGQNDSQKFSGYLTLDQITSGMWAGRNSS
jgi:hypothetical protein